MIPGALAAAIAQRGDALDHVTGRSGRGLPARRAGAGLIPSDASVPHPACCMRSAGALAAAGRRKPTTASVAHALLRVRWRLRARLRSTLVSAACRLRFAASASSCARAEGTRLSLEP